MSAAACTSFLHLLSTAAATARLLARMPRDLAASRTSSPGNIREDWAVSRERRLGRGLEALLGRAWDGPETPAASEVNFESAPEVAADERLSRDEHGQVWLSCEAIQSNPYQPRQMFDEAEI